MTTMTSQWGPPLLLCLVTTSFALTNLARLPVEKDLPEIKPELMKTKNLQSTRPNKTMVQEQAIKLVDGLLSAAKLDNKTIKMVNSLLNSSYSNDTMTIVRKNITTKEKNLMNKKSYKCGVCTPMKKVNPDYMIDLRMHLPPNRPELTCEQLAKNSDDGKEMRQILSQIASSKHDCVKGYRPKAVENGLGASLASLIKPMMHAVKYQQCVYTPKLKMWAGKQDHCKGYECYFQAMAPEKTTTKSAHVSFSKKWASLVEDGERNASFCPTWWGFQREQEDPPENRTEASLSDNCLYSYSFTEQGEAVLPQEFSHRGLFFTVSHIVNHLTRPSKKLQAMIEKAKWQMKWPNDTSELMLSVHVRQGDACIKSSSNFQGRKCDGLAHYIPSIQLMADTYGFKHVFLATDTQEVRDATEDYPQFIWHFQKENLYSQKRSHVLKYLPIEKALKYGVLDAFEEGASYLVDLHLMAQGHGFVGKFTSNLDRLVYNLMGSKADCYRPYISLDSGWCFDYGLSNGDGDTGDFQC
eukprot:jgi/Bigna1/85856/estExt_fgenesh1_pg.C_60268